MAGESKTDKAEQRAFSTIALGFGLTALGSIFLAALYFVGGPMLAGLPQWLQYSLAAAVVVAVPYFIILLVRLGGASEGSEHRDWYAAFRAGVADDHAGGHDARGVRWALAKVDAFFGDAGQANADRWQRLFGLRAPAPLWTAASYDRSLLLALVYPLTIVLLGWVVSGEVLALERALGMKATAPYARVAALALIVAVVGLGLKISQYHGWRETIIIALVCACMFSAMTIGAGTVAVVITVTSLTKYMFGVMNKSSGTIAAIWMMFFCIVDIIAGENPYRVSIMIFYIASVAAMFFGIGFLKKIDSRTMAIVTISFFSLLFTIPIFSPSVSGRTNFYLLYFLGLLTLVNAPFDWVALGISRGLLRRGLERGGWEPLLLGLADIILSLVLMALLALTVLAATEVFNYSAMLGGNRAVIDPAVLFDDLAANASLGNTHHWWLYAMLFSTQIPALINMAFGALCLLRGVPWVNRWTLALLPVGGGMGSWNRLTIAAVQALQLALAVVIACAAYYAIAFGLIALIDPLFGQNLVEGLKSLHSAMRLT